MYPTKEKQNSHLFKYLDAVASIFLVINTDHTIALVNRKGCEVLGYSRNEIIGKNWFNSCLPKSKKEQLVQLFDQIMEGTVEPPDAYENWILTKGNQRVWIHWRNALLKDKNGKITGLISSGIDMTEKLTAEKKLRDIEDKNRAILGALPDVMTVHDKKGTILEVHLPDRVPLIAPTQALYGKNVNEIFPNKVSSRILKTFSKILRTQEMETLEVTAPAINGTADYECRLVPLSKDRILSIARDITQTKIIQNTLDLRNSALEAAGNGIIIADAQQPDQPIQFSNNAFTRMTGYGKNEVLGKNCRFLQNDDRDQSEIKTLALALQKGEACRVILRNYRKDGSLFWNELTIEPLYDKNKKLTHFIGVQNDVTDILRNKNQLEQYADGLEFKIKERTKEIESTVQKLVATNLDLEDQILETKLAENKAQRSQAQFSAIAKNFPKGLIVVFNTKYELVYIEGEELKRVNLKKVDFEGKRIDVIPIFSKSQINTIKNDIDTTLKGRDLSFEVNFEENSYAVNSTPLYSDENKIIWALFVYHNITEKIQVQKELANALKVEQELNELKSRFISMASHEFRTPLSAILSSAILIGKQNETGKEARRMKHVDRIRTNVKNLVVILNDFLSLSKLEEGKVQANPQHFELIQFSKELIAEMESNKKEGQEIVLKHSNTELTVYLDPKLLNHILINLLSNALKYSEEDQEIILEIKCKKTTVDFAISDSGIGIPKKEQKNLFERFFRAQNATNIQGTGLGLHIVKQYTELMGGAVGFTSNLGKGSSFTVKFPINPYKNEKSSIDRR